ncbi:MAG: type III-B CRISPR module RAMP protein Cmr6 [Gammaproteobacteria bacterium]|nr:type III-B CRISPR module RAMP protein Cmr6 [Gammaproteobacteria bacterium]
MTDMANTPLYTAIDGQFEKGNLGLWHNKFCNKWNNKFDALRSKESSKKDWVDDIVTKSKKLAMTPYAGKIQKIADEVVCYQTTEPMIIGMGLNHPIENGMLFHSTLGVPYLPGSSVKGLVRAWAEQWKEDINDAELLRIFGSENRFNDDNTKHTDTQAGSVIFFDALPINKVTLETDIMTPHYPDYYSSQGKIAPADNQDPVPIFFLAVAKGVIFQFAFKARKNESDISDISTVKEWLKLALENLGAGAKTAVGYGRMTFEEPPLERSAIDDWIEEQRSGVLDKIRNNELAMIKDGSIIGTFANKDMITKIQAEDNHQEIYQRMLMWLEKSDKFNENNFIKNYNKAKKQA